MSIQAAQITGVAAGVPFVAVPPITPPSGSKPIVVAWHLMDAPRTEVAFAAALPLSGLDAWRIYLGLPLSGSRTPPGGDEELTRLGFEDAVLNLQGPITHQAAAEFVPALAALRGQLDLGDGSIGVLGGSVGAAVAQLVLAESDVAIGTAVLVSPLVRLHPVVEALARRYDFTYPWSEASLEVARRLDFVARADEIAKRGEPAVLLVVGGDDEPQGFHEPAQQLRDALVSRYADPERAELVVIPGMGHALADEPGVEPAPQGVHAAQVDRHAARWLRRHLTGTGGET
ncbi:MAG: alpha/beta hydrolase [Euzebyales bacterium]|jgi:pimeloyl-ACP methyl ester carboxylesterase|nr:alpha/beta hydrolase [Euzebyales bacterium]